MTTAAWSVQAWEQTRRASLHPATHQALRRDAQTDETCGQPAARLRGVAVYMQRTQIQGRQLRKVVQRFTYLRAVKSFCLHTSTQRQQHVKVMHATLPDMKRHLRPD